MTVRDVIKEVLRELCHKEEFPVALSAAKSLEVLKKTDWEKERRYVEA